MAICCQATMIGFSSIFSRLGSFHFSAAKGRFGDEVLESLEEAERSHCRPGWEVFDPPAQLRG